MSSDLATLPADRGLLPRLAYDGSGAPIGTVGSVEPSGPLEPVEQQRPPSDKGVQAGSAGNTGRGNR